MFGTLTTQKKDARGNNQYLCSNAIIDTYKNTSANIFKAIQKKPKQYKTLTGLLNECPLVGKNTYGLNNLIA